MRSFFLASLFGLASCVPLTADIAEAGAVDSSCTLKGHTLKGKVQIVSSFPDLKVQKVTSFPDEPGKWQMVDSFPDYKIQFVDSFPDFTIEWVDSFPGPTK